MTIDYSWMNSALAWIAPVAAQVNSFYVYPNKLLAFSGVTVSEYDTPFALTKEPFGLQFQPAKTINWSKVTGLAVGKTCDVSISGGKVKLPMIEHFFDPEPISLEGKSYPASDVITAVQQTIGAVDRSVLGWSNCIHFDGDSVISTPADTSVLHHVTLSWELERPAELSYDSAKMIAGIPLLADAEAIFGGETNITKQDGSLYGTSYRSLTIVSGPGRFMTVLAHSQPVSVAKLIRQFYDGIKFYMDIEPDLAETFKMLKSLGQDKVYADLDFKADGLFVSGVGMDAVQVPVSYDNNESPGEIVRLQIALVDINPKKTMHCGYTAHNRPFALFLEDKTVFVMPMTRGA